MYKPKSVLENETYNIIRDFEIYTDHRIPARRPDVVCYLVGFYGISTFTGYLTPNPFLCN